MLLGALIRELPDVFEAEVLTKLSVKDHLALAQVNKECKRRRVQDTALRLHENVHILRCPYIVAPPCEGSTRPPRWGDLTS